MSILISVGHQRGGARNDTDYIIVLIFNDWVLDYFMGYCCGAHPRVWRHIPSLGVRAKTDAMFRNTFQSGFLSILYSIGSKPLQIWDSKVKNGHIKRITDQDIQSSVLEIMGTNVSTSYIVCPNDPKQTLGIKLPFLVMIIKNLNKYFTFEVQVLDDKGVKRRFRASNYQSTTRVKPFICTMPMRLDDGWNQIQFNLSDFTRRAYGTNYVETVRVQIHANCRIRRIYFSDRYVVTCFLVFVQFLFFVLRLFAISYLFCCSGFILRRNCLRSLSFSFRQLHREQCRVQVVKLCRQLKASKHQWTKNTWRCWLLTTRLWTRTRTTSMRLGRQRQTKIC